MRIRNLKFNSIIISYIFFSFNTLSAHVGLDYPKGGETFSVGDTVNVQWHNIVLHNPVDWDLYFSSDGGNVWTSLQLDIPKDQFEYQWIIPNILTQEAQIKIVQDNVGANYEGSSSSFTIQEKTLNVFDSSQTPETPFLMQNYPNPFNPSTTIQFIVPKEANVRISVFDIIGNEIKSLVNSKLLEGHHMVEWNGTNNLGAPVPSGTYIYSMTSNKKIQTMKMILLR